MTTALAAPLAVSAVPQVTAPQRIYCVVREYDRATGAFTRYKTAGWVLVRKVR